MNELRGGFGREGGRGEKRVVIKKQERLARGKRNAKVVSFECFITPKKLQC
jgi:hypothetical protein